MQKYNLTEDQRNLVNFTIQDNMATMNTDEIPAFEQQLIHEFKDLSDHECQSRLHAELEGQCWDKAHEVAYEQLCEDGQLNEPTFDEQFENLTEKLSLDFQAEREEYAQCEDGYYL